MHRRRTSTKLSQSMLGAVQQGNSAQLSSLLAKINTPKRRKKVLGLSDTTGQLPIHVAASGGQIDCLKILLKEDETLLNARDGSQWTPLLCGAANGHLEICSFLLQASCDPSAQNKSGTSALHQLARKIPTKEKEEMYLQVLENILSLVETPDISNNLKETPLHQASMRGNLTAVKLLLENKADVNRCTTFVVLIFLILGY